MSFLKIPNELSLVINTRKITRHFAKFEGDLSSIYIMMNNGREILIEFPSRTEMLEFDDLIRKKKLVDISKTVINIGLELIAVKDIITCEKKIEGVTICHKYEQYIKIETSLARTTEWHFLLDDLEVEKFPWGNDIAPDIQPDFINPKPFDFIMKNIKKLFTKRS